MFKAKDVDQEFKDRIAEIGRGMSCAADVLRESGGVFGVDHSFAIGASLPVPPSWVGFGCAPDFTVQIFSDGKILWHGREIDGDDDFRAAMMDVHRTLACSVQ